MILQNFSRAHRKSQARDVRDKFQVWSTQLAQEKQDMLLNLVVFCTLWRWNQEKVLNNFPFIFEFCSKNNWMYRTERRVWSLKEKEKTLNKSINHYEMIQWSDRNDNDFLRSEGRPWWFIPYFSPLTTFAFCTHISNAITTSATTSIIRGL